MMSLKRNTELHRDVRLPLYDLSVNLRVFSVRLCVTSYA